MWRPLTVFLTLGFLVPSWPASTQVTVGPGEDIEAAIAALGPGDELIVEAGEYTLEGRFTIDLAGTEAQPIVIRAADGERPHLHRPNADQNIVDVDRAEWVTLRGLELSGGSAGIRLSAARFLTIEDCEIHDTGDVALRANDEGVTYESLRILRNHIHHTNGTGEGMYLGCNNDDCRVVNSLIEGNYVHHTNRPTVEQGDGIELKEGSYGNVIRDNVIHDTHYPCILTYGTVGNGPPNVIERNVMWHCGDHAIQSAADAVIRNNLILGANANGIAMQPHQAGSPSNLVVVHNTVLHPENTAISVSGMTGSVVIANNALYARQGSAISVNGDTAGLTLAGNVGVGGVSGAGGGLAEGDLETDFVGAHYQGAPPIDVFPAPGSALIGAGDAAWMTADDFNATPRSGEPDAGAYVFAPAGNPGWTIGEAFKGALPAPPADGGGDGGTTPGDTGPGPGSDTGSGAQGSAGDDEASCSCRSTGAGSSLSGLLGLAIVRRRRRRT